ncbi:MAG TPA: patatin-like phospholipase family protein [Bryobacteraceae bacterium]|nr:patatin-like phospholipase family protein [Bryobacteraceae bacterium]HUJ21822.1 patatin-like phospholipase family protein [Bryobacteraceae bacterium]
MGAKTALVLSAGGMFGAYQVGAWRELSGYFQPDLVVGTSVGALNGWAIAAACAPEELMRLWTSESAGAFLRLRKPLLPWRSLFDPVIFSQQVRDLASAFKPRIPVGIVLADVLRRRPRLVQGGEIEWQHLAAACAIPGGLPPVRIEGRWYVDGGLLSVLPLWAAREMGATRAIAINALPALPSRVLRAGVKAYRALSPQASAPAAPEEVITIAPGAALGSLRDTARWSRETVSRWIEQGAEDARRIMQSNVPGRDGRTRVLQ